MRSLALVLISTCVFATDPDRVTGLREGNRTMTYRRAAGRFLALGAAGTAQTDAGLFTELDLSRPGLEPVAAALARGDGAAARHALAE